MIEKKFAKLLKMKIQEKQEDGWIMEEIAAKCKCTRQNLYLIIRDRKPQVPKLDGAEEIARAMGFKIVIVEK